MMIDTSNESQIAYVMVISITIFSVIGHIFRLYLLKHYGEIATELGIVKDWRIGVDGNFIKFLIFGRRNVNSRYIAICRAILIVSFIVFMVCFYMLFLHTKIGFILFVVLFIISMMRKYV
jgi:glycerol-3-phosphate acyltransferase PlsY